MADTEKLVLEPVGSDEPVPVVLRLFPQPAVISAKAREKKETTARRGKTEEGDIRATPSTSFDG
jgi:hypothetical protein